MNQILSSKSDNENIDNTILINKKKNYFKILFIICCILSSLSVCYYIYYLYDNNKKEQLSHQLIDNFNITNLYNSNYNVLTTSSANTTSETNTPFYVIGIVEINSIGINYPIISELSDEYLKISPCRFFGPMPNEIGNLCIAGHNYNNYKFFSRLKKLNIGDIINIYDLSGRKIEYSVYSSTEIDYNNLDCTSQNTNGKREVTLITCNNIKNKRRVIKASEVGRK